MDLVMYARISRQASFETSTVYTPVRSLTGCMRETLLAKYVELGKVPLLSNLNPIAQFPFWMSSRELQPINLFLS